MALTLTEAAKLSNDNLQRGVVEEFVVRSAVLDVVPLIKVEGNSYKYNREGALPGVEFRAVNAAYTESTGTFVQASEALVIMGGDADVDKFIVRTRGNLNDQRATQTRMKVKSAVFKWQDTFINGDVAVDTNSFDGLKKRLTGAQVIPAGTNGLAVIGADDNARHAFLDKLDEAIAAVANPEVLYMNELILAKLRSSARRLTIYDQTRDDFGRLIEFYNGLPMRDIGRKSDGTTLIIPQTETQGASSICSSIYVVGFAEDEAEVGVAGIHNGPSEEEPIEVTDLGEIDAKPVFRTRIEFYCGLVTFGGKAAARLAGVLNS